MTSSLTIKHDQKFMLLYPVSSISSADFLNPCNEYHGDTAVTKVISSELQYYDDLIIVYFIDFVKILPNVLYGVFRVLLFIIMSDAFTFRSPIKITND